ncbi:hypothetical protein CALCODRAFT_514317 [Calocera cornea HHB12733]|uniref:DUF6535 domain-containing protein n=1 Tax=Calocera cornea HHB12733 TaxID=1353952 RepID=A0A165JJM4_9BASI|nr:hypothetical protein CALCODRAFT_514317 [Calocera cornea HHB12733]
MPLGREVPLPEDFWGGLPQNQLASIDEHVTTAASTTSPGHAASIDLSKLPPLPDSVHTSSFDSLEDVKFVEEDDGEGDGKGDGEGEEDDEDDEDASKGIFGRKFINDLPPVGRGPEAPVWPIYNEHAEKADKEMLETYNGGMDNLLIFAALFSAVVTAFIVLALPLLQADPSQPIVDALNLISLQLASQGASNISTTMASTESNAASPTFSPVSINALWIMSLFVSLSTSVLAMLVKQWLRGYITNLPLAQKERATTRQARYEGVQSWRVAGIADSLPVLIHLAVALFLAGLVLYLSSLSMDLMWLVSILAVLGALGYLVLAMLPLFWPHQALAGPNFRTRPQYTIFRRLPKTWSSRHTPWPG